MNRNSGLGWVVCAASVLVAVKVVQAAGEPLPAQMDLALGELQSITVSDLNRVAVGDPSIADVSIPSSDEVLIHAQNAGTTNLVIWDQRGRSSVEIHVIDKAIDEVIGQIQRVLAQLNYVDVRVHQEGKKVYLSGQVPTDSDRARIEQVVTLFPGVVNLTIPTPPPPKPPEVPAPLIRLGVQMIEISTIDLKKLGVKWSEALSLTEPAVSDLTYQDSLFTRWGTSLTRTSIGQTLNALVRNNHARLLAEPKLVTTSGKPAESFLGQQIPILSASETGDSGAVSSTVEFRDVGVKLKMTPTVTEDGSQIITDLESEISTIDDSTAITINNATVPGTKNRKAKTQIICQSGETVVVAGLIQSEDSRIVDKVPGAGDIPVLGRLFRSPEVEKTQTELVIAVTPELLDAAGVKEDKDFALERTLASAELAGSVDDPKLRYALLIQDRIAKALRYPQREGELGLEGRVTIRVHVFADGTLGRALVSESSGIEALDAEALKIAETQAPYPAIPADLSLKDVWLDIPVIFRR